MVEEVQIHGLDELRRKLKELPDRVAKRALATSVSAGARVIVKDAKARVPIRTGKLRKNIVARRGRTRNKNEVLVHVGVRARGKASDDKNAFYWRFVEFGTSKTPARPFLRPAFESQKHQAVNAIRKKLAERIEIEVKKL